MRLAAVMVVKLLAAALALGGAAACANAGEAPGHGGLCAAAVSLVAQQATEQDLQADVHCKEPAPVPVKTARAHWRLAAPVDLKSGTARVLLAADMPHAGAHLVAVPVWLTMRSAAWVAAREMNAGSRVAKGDLQVQQIDWPVGVKPVPAAAEQPTGRAKVALRPGDWVTMDRLLPADEGVQGDPVTVQLHEKNLTVEAPGLLTADARVGNAARVQLAGQRTVLEGQLVNLTTVVVGR